MPQPILEMTDVDALKEELVAEFRQQAKVLMEELVAEFRQQAKVLMEELREIQELASMMQEQFKKSSSCDHKQSLVFSEKTP